MSFRWDCRSKPRVSASLVLPPCGKVGAGSAHSVFVLQSYLIGKNRRNNIPSCSSRHFTLVLSTEPLQFAREVMNRQYDFHFSCCHRLLRPLAVHPQKSFANHQRVHEFKLEESERAVRKIPTVVMHDNDSFLYLPQLANYRFPSLSISIDAHKIPLILTKFL